MTENFYVTTPIYYVNGSPHIGHAYTSIAADVLARFNRLDGRDVFFLTGVDEHGQKVEKAAATEGQSPQAYVDRLAADFRLMSDELDVSYDDFIRTTEGRHRKACEFLWQKLVASDQIYLGSYSGWYSIRDEAFYAEDELVRRPDGGFQAPTGAGCRLGVGAVLLLQAFSMAGHAPRPARGAARFRQSAVEAQRGSRVRQVGVEGPFGQSDELPVGHRGSGRSGPRHVCLVRCPHQLHLGVGLAR